MNNILKAGLIATSVISLVSCSKPTETRVTDKILIDQCGYTPSHPKVAFISEKAKNFSVVNSDGKTVYTGKVAAAQFYAEANESYRRIDFSSVTDNGIYTIVVDDSLSSYPFEIGNTVYSDLAKSSLRAFYYNRSGMAIDSIHGGKWARPAGHPDTNVMVHKSAASSARPEGTVISSPLGWYDAGDYNKYIVNSGITTYTMLMAAVQYNHLAVKINLNIPESGNMLPDILNETLYNLRWMLTMQDPNDGGVYHKLTTLSFESFIMPDECKQQRYVVAKGTAATLDFAATMAYAARHLNQFCENNELASLADSCKKAAAYAYSWAEKNPDVKFRNPEDVSTGEYGDFFLGDEWFWASSEMWLLTGDEKYGKKALDSKMKPYVPHWGGVVTLGYYSMATEGKEYEGINAKHEILALADSLVVLDEVSPIALSLQQYDWGSNSSVANHGMAKLIAYKLSGDVKYYNSALDDLHYILGRNPLGLSMVTGVGYHSPRNIHHRVSASDGIDEPVPGFLCGGPNIVQLNDCGDEPVERSQYPATSYADITCSYSTNEIAINWNAPLVFLVWGVENQ